MINQVVSGWLNSPALSKTNQTMFYKEKEMKQKSLLIVGLLLVAIVFTACAPATTPAPAPATQAPAPVTQAPAPTTAPTTAPAKPIRIAVIMPSATNDAAFSQSMWSALQSVQKDMGGASAMEIAYTDNLFNVPDAAAAIRDYASKGYDIVIAHGSQYGSSVQDIAPDFPNTTFAWGTDVNTFGMPNVYAYTAAAEQGGYVNGVLAAKLTKSKIIGVTGPIEVGDAKTYIDGFVQGVTSVDPTIKVNKTWTGSFSDVALMTAAAKTHIQAGADILTGSSQSVVGSIGAAKDAGNVLWFGTQSDQASLAPSLVVASQVYDWTAMIKDMIAKHQAGTLGGSVYTLTLANSGLKIAYNPGYTLAADVKAAGDAAIQGITAGTITVNP
jgi:basic membrane lipoprotein Med (substrate-binding protein (PBP1-ABC) superfamily)